MIARAVVAVAAAAVAEAEAGGVVLGPAVQAGPEVAATAVEQEAALRAAVAPQAEAPALARVLVQAPERAPRRRARAQASARRRASDQVPQIPLPISAARRAPAS